jgi:hypothetical protein
MEYPGGNKFAEKSIEFQTMQTCEHIIIRGKMFYEFNEFMSHEPISHDFESNQRFL